VHEVKADIRRIESYSGHGDYHEMCSFLKCQDLKKIDKTFLVHGEYETQLTYKSYLEGEGFKNLYIPSVKDEYTI
jgi:metallo-beta-lactamase family protein